MRSKEIRLVLRDLADVFDAPIAYCSASKNRKNGYWIRRFENRPVVRRVPTQILMRLQKSQVLFEQQLSTSVPGN